MLLIMGVVVVGYLNLAIAPQLLMRERGLKNTALSVEAFKDSPLTASEENQGLPIEKPVAVKEPIPPAVDLASITTSSINLPTEGPSEVLFRTNSAAISKKAEEILEKALEYLSITRKSLLIQGHSDIRGTVEINNLLSFRRAKSTRDWLIDHGASMERISIKGLGARYPSALTGTIETFFAKNRRVELIWQ